MIDNNRPPVDIIIPFHGQYESVTRCIGSILACTPNQDYQIILVDDGSANKKYLKFITDNNKAVKGVVLDEQRGFGAALYEGFKVTTGSHIVIMHSDVWVSNVNWLLNMQRALIKYKKSGVKLISARASNPGTSASYDDRMFGEANDTVEDFVSDYPVPLICSYCNRELFKRIGGFVKPYPYGWFEDEELFWRMKHFRFRQMVIGNTWVNHEGALTIKELWRTNVDSKSIMESNRDQCLQDVRPYLPKKSNPAKSPIATP
jgi:glycosyltransferase involved in cell wall biosynthesis